MKHGKSILLTATLMLVTAGIGAEERLDLEGTSIIGSNELPKVLYIVPWKKIGMSKLTVSPEMSLVNKALAPIDRHEFHRQIDLYYAMKQSE